MPKPGRPKSAFYEQLNFELVKLRNKYVAICGVCKKHLHNTAISRLRGHRNICKPQEQESKGVSTADVELNNSNVNEESATILYVIGDDHNMSNEMDDSNLHHSDNDSLLKLIKNNSSAFELIDRNSSQLASTTTYPSMSSSSSSSRLCSSSSLSLPSSNSSLSLISSGSTFPCTTKTPTRKKGSTLSSYLDLLSPKDVDEIHESLANFVFGCNLPLRIIESRHFKNFVQKLRPAYANQIPDRRMLSTKLLDNAYENCLSKAKAAIQPNSVLLIDGWKNSATNSKIVVSMIHNSDGQQAFIDAWDLTGISETGDKLSDIVLESVDKAKSLYETEIYAVVSDNAAAMIRMGDLSSHVVWPTTCNSHTANLLAKDVLNKEINEKVISVMKEFKNSDLQRAIVEKGGHKIKLPCDTRWCSYRDTFACFVNNLEFMKLVAADKNCKKIKNNVTQLIFDDQFVDHVKENLQLFEPICEIINSCQKLDTSIADAVNLWLTLKLPDKFQDKFGSNVQTRKRMAFNKYSLTAFYLHPYYDKNLLENVDKNVVYDFLFKHLDGDGIEGWDCFRNRSGLFKILNEKEIKRPIVFWSMADIKYPQLSKLAIKLLQIPASTAQIERLFSSWGYVHSSIRNRLVFERSKKLLHVYYSLRTADLDNNISDLDLDDLEID